MLIQYINVLNYDWRVYVFYNVSTVYRSYLVNSLKFIGYSNIIKDIDPMLNLYNSGYCYTNFNDKTSIIIVNRTTSREETFNTIVHEINHLSSHIEEYYKIDPHGEEACYLIGDLAQQIFHFLSDFL